MITRKFYFKYPKLSNVLTMLWNIFKFVGAVCLCILAGSLTFPKWQGTVTWYTAAWFFVGLGEAILGILFLGLIWSIYYDAAEANRKRFEDPWR